jgi:hypothetical protein
MGDGENLRESKNVKTFKAFREDFLREIRLPEFGEAIDVITKKNPRSAASKELEKTGATRILSSDGFLRFAHGSLRECARLTEQQKKARKVASGIGPLIKRLRDHQKTLSQLQKQIMKQDKRLENVLRLEFRLHFKKAVKELELVEDALSDIEQTKASHIHPQLRKKHDKTAEEGLRYTISRWRSLDQCFDHELDSLNKKAPMQWLIEALDSGLRRRCKKAQIKVSCITRYRIIAEVLVSGGLPEISADTIKQHFIEKRRLPKLPARNSQAS